MAENQTRNLTASDIWRARATRPAGLYGELPPLPARFSDNSGPSVQTAQSRSTTGATD